MSQSPQDVPPAPSGAPDASAQQPHTQATHAQAPYAQAPYAQPPYAQPSYAPAPLTPDQERNWAVGAHLGSFAAAYVALGFLGPLIVLLAVGNRSAYVRSHAVAALNFNISVLLYLAVSVPLILLLIGIPMIIGIGVTYLVATILGAVAASRGETYRYPLTLRFVK